MNITPAPATQLTAACSTASVPANAEANAKAAGDAAEAMEVDQQGAAVANVQEPALGEADKEEDARKAAAPAAPSSSATPLELERAGSKASSKATATASKATAPAKGSTAASVQYHK